MDILEAKRRREIWQDRSCDHPDWTPETINGKPTGDEVCTQCGQTRWVGRLGRESSSGNTKRADEGGD